MGIEDSALDFQETESPPSSEDIYFKLLGIDRLSRLKSELLPESVALPPPWFASLEEQILKSTKVKEEAGVVVWNPGLQMFEEQVLKSGKSHEHKTLEEEIKRRHSKSDPALLLYHTHPSGKMFGTRDLETFLLYQRAYFIAGFGGFRGGGFLFRAKENPDANFPWFLALRRIQDKIKRSGLDRIDTTASNHKEFGDFLLEEGFVYYVWSPQISLSGKIIPENRFLRRGYMVDGLRLLRYDSFPLAEVSALKPGEKLKMDPNTREVFEARK